MGEKSYFSGLVWSRHVTDGAIFVLSSLCPSSSIISISLNVTKQKVSDYNTKSKTL
jgi:hypothetical protein